MILSVHNVDHLLDWADYFHWHKVEYSVFHEPDLKGDPGGWHTALAVVPLGPHRKVLAHLPLMKGGEL